jgi:hypothetical protein
MNNGSSDANDWQTPVNQADAKFTAFRRIFQGFGPVPVFFGV